MRLASTASRVRSAGLAPALDPAKTTHSKFKRGKFVHIFFQMTSGLNPVKLWPIASRTGRHFIPCAAWFLGADRYIGLGIPTIVEAFQHPLAPYDFAG
jgi:hypothetical protein